MKILILGSSGFLGKYVLNEFSKKKFEIFNLTRKKVKKKNFFTCDLTNLKLLNFYLKKINPHVIINLAAEVNFKKKTKNMYKINSCVPAELAKFCKKRNKFYVHASGIIVNGLSKTYNFKTKLKPTNDYGVSKLQAENYIKKINCNYSIIRFGGIYGKNGPNHLKVNYFIKRAIKGKKITFSGNAKSLRNYVFVEDAAKFIFYCVNFRKKGIFYIGGKKYSFFYMIETINKILGKNKKVVYEKNNEKKFNQIINYYKKFKPSSFKKTIEAIKCK